MALLPAAFVNCLCRFVVSGHSVVTRRIHWHPERTIWPTKCLLCIEVGWLVGAVIPKLFWHPNRFNIQNISRKDDHGNWNCKKSQKNGKGFVHVVAMSLIFHFSLTLIFIQQTFCSHLGKDEKKNRAATRAWWCICNTIRRKLEPLGRINNKYETKLSKDNTHTHQVSEFMCLRKCYDTNWICSIAELNTTGKCRRECCMWMDYWASTLWENGKSYDHTEQLWMEAEWVF